MITKNISNMKQKVNTQILNKYFGIILVLILCFWAIKPLLNTGFFPIHDNEQIARLFDLDQALKAGHIPPRIAPNLGFGYGYPFFNFYPPFAYYVAEIFKAIGFSYIVSIKVMIGLGFILAAVFMYLLAKEFFGKIGGLVSSVAYTYTPYHAVDVYVRGALPEFWSFVFLPIIFWSYYKLALTSRLKFVLIAGFSNGCLILTHNLIALMAVPFILVWLIFLYVTNNRQKKFLVNSILSILFSICITSYFWLPSIFEKQYTMVDLLTKELANYNQHFVYIRQFWDSPWGYGGSIYGLHDGLSFQVGKINIIVSFLAFFASIYLLRKKRKISYLLLILFSLFIFSLFMASFHSKLIWDLIQPLWYVQFPWRFLLFSAFTSSLIIGVVGIIGIGRVNRFFLSSLVIGLIIIVNKSYFKPSLYFLHATDYDYTNQETIRWDTSKQSWEYVPKGIKTKISDINTTLIDIEKKDIAKKSFRVINGDMVVLEKVNLPQKKRYLLLVKRSGLLMINTYSFPGWKVYLDEHEIEYTDNNKLKLISVGVPKGAHILEARFTDTIPRLIGNGISISSIIMFCIYGIFVARKKYDKA